MALQNVHPFLYLPIPCGTLFSYKSKNEYLLCTQSQLELVICYFTAGLTYTLIHPSVAPMTFADITPVHFASSRLQNPNGRTSKLRAWLGFWEGSCEPIPPNYGFWEHCIIPYWVCSVAFLALGMAFPISNMGKPSTTGQPTRPTQPFIHLGLINK